VFPKAEITRDVEIVGASTHRWSVATMAKHGAHTALFEPVNKHHASIVNVP
jgi:hypothetical protein